MRFRDTTVLVTGASGFVGGRLAERLILGEGAKVRTLVRCHSKEAHLQKYGVDCVRGDIRDPVAVRTACEGCAVVFHCASGGTTRDEYFSTNVEGTANVLDAAQEMSVRRFVHISSIAVHGPWPPDNADESAPFVLTGHDYGDSKTKAEELVWNAYRQARFPVTVIRPTFVWGPRSEWFTCAPLRAMKNSRFHLIDDGRGACHAVYIDNLVDAILLGGISTAAIGEAFIISDGLDLLWRDFFLQYALLLGIGELSSWSSESLLVRAASKSVDVLEFWMSRLSGVDCRLWTKIARRACHAALNPLKKRGIPNGWDLQKYARRGGLRIDKARRLLGYAPKVDLESGMRVTAQWVREHMGQELGLEETPERLLSGCGDTAWK